MPVRIIGVDPGSNVTGWGIIDRDGSRLIHVAHGQIRASGRKPIEDRLVEIYDALEAVLREHAPVHAGVELPFVSENPQTAIVLGHARGAAVLALARTGVMLASYPPATVKQAITGSGKAEKAQVQLMVKTLLNLRERPPVDAADALAVAICHAFRLRR